MLGLAYSNAQAATLPRVSYTPDRYEIRSPSGLTCKSSSSPDYLVQVGTYNEQNSYAYTNSQNTNNDKGVYAQFIIPLGKSKPVDCNKLYNLELEARKTEIEQLKEQVRLLKATQQQTTFSE